MNRVAIQHAPFKPRAFVRLDASTLKQRSKKQAGKDRRRAPHKRVYLALHPNCEAHVADTCSVRSVHVHEPWTRAQGGPIDDEANYLAVCSACHRHIHTHPIEARARGFLVKASHGAIWLAARKAAA